jgi:hypothetical protein
MNPGQWDRALVVPDLFLELVMKRKVFFAIVIATAAVTVTSPAFASGYGPAPYYWPEVGAPASQRGQSSLTLATELLDNSISYAADVGGMAASTSESGGSVLSSMQLVIDQHH